MKNNIWIILILLSAVGFSLYLRIVLPYDQVFTPEWVKFTSVDAYWQMDFVDRIAPVFNEYLFKMFEVPFFVWLISGTAWMLGWGSPSQSLIDTVGAYFPAILGSLTIIPVYFIGRELFSKGAGVFAAILIAVLPGEWLGRSILGFTDHHVAAVLFSTTMMLFLILAINNFQKRRYIYGLLSGLFGVMLYLTEGSGLVFGVLLTFSLFIITVNDLLKGRINIKAILVFGIVSLFGWAFIYSNFASLAHQIGGFAMGNTPLTTLEMRPILFPVGNFTPMIVWGNFGFIVLLFPGMITLLIYKTAKSGNYNWILFVVWTIAMLVLMFQFRRFAYYFAINATLITGWFIWYVWDKLERKYYIPAIMVTFFFIAMTVIPNAQNAMATAKTPNFAPSDAWMETLDWIEENTEEDSLIVSWWDYGYWIKREANRDAYVNPSQDPGPVKNVASMFFDGDIVEGDYLILDNAVTTGKLWAVAIWADKAPTDYADYYKIITGNKTQFVRLYYPAYYESLAARLYNFDGKAVIPTQSTAITAKGNIVATMDILPTYAEAVAAGGRIVGTQPFESPVPLEAVEGFELVYESEIGISGVSEVKVFRYVE